MRRTRPRPPKAALATDAAPETEAQGGAPLRRSEILAIAARHFAERGFEAATIRQISDEAGILSGSLYYYFSNKEDIIHEIMRPFATDMISKYHQISRLSDPADVLIAKMLRFALEQIRVYHREHEILFNDRKYLRRSTQFAYIATFREEVSHAWYSVIQQGVRDGTLRGDVDIRLTTTMILKLISATADWYDPDGHDSLEAMIEAQQALILGGLLAREPAKRPRKS